jgi:transposase InsO family protein
MEARECFIADWSTGAFGMADLCRRHGISRKTGYKWVARFRGGGLPGLRERSRAPLSHPNQVSGEVRRVLLRERDRHPDFGAKKLVARLKKKRPNIIWPAISTAHEVLVREGRLRKRRRVQRPAECARSLAAADGPNAVWTADYKGQFRLGNGTYCYPLTIVDGYSRYLLSCTALGNTGAEDAWRVFEAGFREFGLPEVIRTDNGCPFAGSGAGRLSGLSVKWLKLGIAVDRIRPAHPEDNGSHERLHRTLKAATTRPPSFGLSSQGEAFAAFRRDYNEERPHEALGQVPPSEVYRPSERRYTGSAPEPEYPGHWEVRRVRSSGEIKWRGGVHFLSKPLARERVGLSEVEDGVWLVVFVSHPVAVWNERDAKLCPIHATAGRAGTAFGALWAP